MSSQTNITPTTFSLYDQTFSSRIFLGTSRYPSPQILVQALQIAQPAMITASLRRQGANPEPISSGFWEIIKDLKIPILPNTAGCHRPEEVMQIAHMSREVFATDWIKLELIGDDYTLQPDTIQLVPTAQQLIREGFKVLPYCTEDLVVCQRLVDVGCQAIMPWAAPIGTGKGPNNPYALQVLRERLQVPMIIDAGLGKPSHACQVMEWGYDAVLLNTAVALARHPVRMAEAFAQAVLAGRNAFEAGPMNEHHQAKASTPTLGTPFWHQAESSK
ncbi:MAG: thiazole synthase [Polynucleobacter sp.]|nr:thiazole synthase [Polynucleobacter sp.]